MQALAIEAIPTLSGGLLWLALLHGLWLGLAAAGVVAIAFRVRWRLSHRARRTILLAALGLVAIGPPVLASMQRLINWRRPGDGPAAESALVVVTPAPPGGPSQASASVASQRPGTPAPAATLRGSLAPALDRVIALVEAARPPTLAAWSLVVLGLSSALVLGARQVVRLRREAVPAPATVQERARRLGRLARLRTVPPVRVHATLGEPCLCGAFRPVVLLPARWLASARPESVDAVLAHELAHARRLDHLVNLAQRVLEVLLFFHPGVHWLSRSLRRQCEHGADALAVRLTGDPLALARALESMARFRAGPLAPRRLGATFRGESTSLLPRIQELIGMTPTRPRLSAWPLLALPSAAAVALVAASIGFAHDEKPRTEAPQASPRTPADAKPAPLPAQHVSAPENDRQISYSLRLIDAPESTWRDWFQSKLTPCEPNSGGQAWLLDDGPRDALVKYFESNESTTSCQAPKITTFENARATVSMGLGTDDGTVVPSGLEDDDGSAAPWLRWKARPDQKIGGSLRVDMTGAFSPRGTRNTVKIVETEYDHPLPAGQADALALALADADSRDDAGIRSNSRSYRFATSCEVPMHSNLLISMGTRACRVEGKIQRFERLALIKPMPVILEEDQTPTASAVANPK